MTTQDFASFDGARLRYDIEGDGRTVLMLHGFLANTQFNWVDPGVAAAIKAAGFRIVMLDFRGHGRSAAPTDAAAYPPDVLARDAEALIAHLDLADYDLVGYSLGARIAVRMLARGARPRRCVLGGLGDSGVVAAAQRMAFFADAIRNGEQSQFPQAAKVIHAMMANAGLDPQVMLHVLDSQRETAAAELARIGTPTLVVAGAADADNGSAEGLAALLANARAERVPGNHLTAVRSPELAQAIVRFLREA